jgi:hypothetical protein
MAGLDPAIHAFKGQPLGCPLSFCFSERKVYDNLDVL